MPDPVKVDGDEGQKGGPTPAFNPEEMQKLVSQEVARQMEEDRRQDPYLDAGPTPGARPEAKENPLEAVIAPFVDPKIRAIGIAANAAKDAALFYAVHPEAIKYKDDVEQAFDTMVQQGNPLNHDTIWNWYKGKNFDKFSKEQAELDAKKIEDARGAEGQGPGVRPAGGVAKDAFTATDDELNAGLKDVTF